MRNRILDRDFDMSFGQGPANFWQNTPEAVAQAVLTRLRLWRGQWFLEQDAGTAYVGGVLGHGTADIAGPTIRRTILGVDGVTELVSLEVTSEDRTVTISAVINTAYGEAEINEVL